MVIAGCGGGGAGEASGAPLAQVGRTESLALASRNTGADYPIDIYLPPQYDANPQGRLPVIYAVDGDAKFGYPGGATRFNALKQVLQQRGTAAILVGVGGTLRRGTDFLPPGSVSYHAFLTQELAPRIDAQYRTDTAKRILTGLSYGGTITFLAFTYEATGSATFGQFWSIETAPPNGDTGSLLAADAAMAAQVQGRDIPRVLYFGAGAQSGNLSNGAFVGLLYTQVLSRKYQGLDLQFASFGTDHVGTDLPAFNEALNRFLP